MDPLSLNLTPGIPAANADATSASDRRQKGVEGEAEFAKKLEQSLDQTLEEALESKSGPVGDTEASRVLLSQAAKRTRKQLEESTAGVAGAPMLASLAAPPVAERGERAAALRAGDTTAERVPETQFAAASLRSGESILEAGPWSKDWVFHPGDARNPQLKSLLGHEASKEAAPAGLAGLLQQLRQAESQVDQEISSTRARLGAQESQSVASAADSSAIPAELRGLMSELGAESVEAQGSPGLERQGAQPGANAHRAAGASGALAGTDFMQAREAAQAPIAAKQRSALDGASAGRPGQALSGPAPKLGRAQMKSPTEPQAGFDPMIQSYVARPQGVGPALVQSGAAIPVISGQTTTGAAMRDRLASESLKQMTSAIGSIAARGPGLQNGEMRIRLKPEDLGELQVRVTTQGNQVGLEFQASDERAKKIIEESLVHLKDSLAQQSLVLGKADVGLGMMASREAASQQDFGQQQSAANQYQQNSAASWGAAQQQQGGMNQQRGFSSGRDSEAESSSAGAGGSRASRAKAAAALSGVSSAARAQVAMTNGRLDVTA